MINLLEEEREIAENAKMKMKADFDPSSSKIHFELNMMGNVKKTIFNIPTMGVFMDSMGNLQGIEEDPAEGFKFTMDLLTSLRDSGDLIEEYPPGVLKTLMDVFGPFLT